MRSSCLIIAIFGLVIIFTSCQRELNFSADRVTGTNDSIYLRQYVELNTTLPTGLDTTYKVTYSYDAQKRVVQSFKVLYGFGSPDIETCTYFYSGSDTLPFKAVETYSDFINDYRDTIFLFYNGVIVSKDSLIGYDITNGQLFEISVKTYTASGNNTFLQSRGYFTAPPALPDYQWSGTIFQTRANGNITIQNDTTTFSTVYTDRLHHEVSYDDKINPFYRVEIRRPILNGYKIQKNNVLESRSWDIPGQFEDEFQCSYTYRGDGYPLSVIITDRRNPSDVFKGFYFYTK